MPDKVDNKPSKLYYVLLIIGVVVVLSNVIDIERKTILNKTIEVYNVKGYSMYTPYEEGDKIVVHKDPQEYKRFDVVVFEQEVDGVPHLMVKRIIGLPNEEIVFKGSTLFIDNLEVRQKYADSRYYLTKDFSAKTTESCFYLLGDNRRNSIDSREFGCVMKDKLIGVVLE